MEKKTFKDFKREGHFFKEYSILETDKYISNTTYFTKYQGEG